MVLKRLAVILLFLLSLTACSAGGSEKSEMSADQAKQSSDQEDQKSEMNVSLNNSESDSDQAAADSKEKSSVQVVDVNRMVIYHAELNLEVKNFETARKGLEEKAKSYNGYIVQSNSNSYDGEQRTGTMTFRIPEQHFREFLNDAEGLSLEVNSREVSGEDVTEEFVDLESRMKSKRVVEARLLDFMNSAQKTEDLLKISDDLAIVQEDIEKIAGRKKFLENQTALSTVTLTLEENAVAVPKIENDQLNTWQKIKKQFADNINLLLAFGSGLMVFIFGNLPILLIVTLLMLAVFFTVKKKASQKHE